MGRAAVRLGHDGLQVLLDELAGDGRRVWAPVVGDDVVTVAPVSEADDLPVGWDDEQGPGHYRLVHTGAPTRFAWTVGPQTWKPLVHPPDQLTHVMHQVAPDAPVEVEVRRPARERRALVGVRPCEVAALERLATVFDRSGSVERDGDDDLVVAVTCTSPAATCFCASMGTGPDLDAAAAGVDIALTELESDGEVVYLATAGTDAGADLLDRLVATGDRDVAAPADDAAVGAAAAAHDAARAEMTRSVPNTALHGALLGRADASEWNAVGERCLACGNCTSVCPTCFCTGLIDLTSVTAPDRVERHRTWDTCYSVEFSRLGPGPVRPAVAMRYRQWLTHKFDTWHDQFGTSGCVGCGRCITWCPVGIDVTAEIAAVLTARPTPAGTREEP